MSEIILAEQKGHCTAETVKCDVSVGSVAYSANAISLKAGQTYSFSLIAAAEERLLELEELHCRNDGVFAYSVSSVDEQGEQMLYFRDYEPSADAPNGCFIRLPENLSPSSGRITFKISVEYGTVRLYAARLYPMKLLESPEEKMLAGFFTPPFYTNDRDKTVDGIKKLCNAVTPQSHMLPMISFEIPYMNRTDREISEYFSEWLEIAVQTNTPLFVNLNSWWGGTPGGPDGKGGYFGDIEYQQVSFDPATKEYRLSVPNMWSNTPWLTMNHPVLNRLRTQRLGVTIRLIQRIIAERSVVGTIPSVSLFLDNEPAYWAAFAYGGDPDAGGDFSPFLLEDAAADGVEFPEGRALEDTHRGWLLKNMNRYITELAQVCHEQECEEPVVLCGGKEIKSSHPITANVYTHVFPFAGYPYMNFDHPQWETHVTPYAKLGMESSTPEDTRILDYAVRMGTFGNINSERACMHDYDVFLQQYVYGSDACMIFNYREGDAEAVDALGRQFENELVTERDFPIPVVNVDVFNDGMSDPAIITSKNMSVFGYRNRRVLRPEKLGTGSMLIRAGKAGDYGKEMAVELWAFSHRETGRITLSVGRSPEAAKRSVYLPEHGNEGSPITVDISLSGFEPQDTVWLLIEIRADTFDADWCMLNYIWNIRLMRRHSNRAGHTDGFRFSAPQLRRINRMLACRADGHKQAVESNSEVFYVIDHGTLGKSGLKCSTDKPVFLKTEYLNGETVISAEGDSGTVFRIQNAHAESLATDRWKISRADADAVLTVASVSLPKSVTGRYSGISGRILKIENQDCAERGGQPRVELPINENAVFRLREGTEQPFIEVLPDQLPPLTDCKITCNETGVIKGDFTIHRIEGTVVSAKPVTLRPDMKNAEVTVKTENGVYTFTIGRECRLAYSDAPHRCISGCPDGDPKLTMGQNITVRYSESSVASVLPRAIEINENLRGKNNV